MSFADYPSRRNECVALKEQTIKNMRATNRVTIRAHHILCHICCYGQVKYPDTLQPKIIEEMQKNPALEIRLVAGLDDLCYCCPICINNRCDPKGSMFARDMEKDQAVLQRLRLVSGAVLPAKKVFARVAERIPRVADLCENNWIDEKGQPKTSCSDFLSGNYEKAIEARFWD